MDIDYLFMGAKQLQEKEEDNGLWICLRLHDEKDDTLLAIMYNWSFLWVFFLIRNIFNKYLKMYTFYKEKIRIFKNDHNCTIKGKFEIELHHTIYILRFLE